ncbi:MAG TPA: hypothetical protein PK771_16060, partial [Spirochaetota bacterium]|nr:hypothetical protein [Spirochaetota bacterium]
IIEKINNLEYFNWSDINYDIDDANYKNITENIEKLFNSKKILNLTFTGYLTIENLNNFNLFLNTISNNFFKLTICNNVKLKPEIDKIVSVLDNSYIKDIIKEIESIRKNNSILTDINISNEILNDVLDDALISIYNFYIT